MFYSSTNSRHQLSVFFMSIFRSVFSLRYDSIWRFCSELSWLRIFPFFEARMSKKQQNIYWRRRRLDETVESLNKTLKKSVAKSLRLAFWKTKQKIVQCFLGGKMKCFAQPSLLFNQVKAAEKWLVPDRRNVSEVSFGCHSTFTQRGFIPTPPKRIWGQNNLKSVEEIRLLRLYIGVNIRKPVFSWSLAK